MIMIITMLSQTEIKVISYQFWYYLITTTIAIKELYYITVASSRNSLHGSESVTISSLIFSNPKFKALKSR